MMNTLRDSLLEIEAGTANIKGTKSNFTIVHPGAASYGYLAIQSGSTASYLYQWAPDYAPGADARPSGITLRSNGAGGIGLSAINGGLIRFFTDFVSRGAIHPSGGFSWGSETDPGAGVFSSSSMKSASGSVTGNSGVAVALFTIPATGAKTALYIVVSTAFGDAINYNCYMIIGVSGNSARVLHQVNATGYLTLSLSGMTVLGMQSSGGNGAVWDWSYLRITS